MFAGQWEYQIAHITDFANGTGSSQELNQLGKEGWEVVSLFTASGKKGYLVFLKRKTA